MPDRQLQWNAAIGLVVSLLLATAKLCAGLWGRSSALVADAVESFADTIGSALVWQALRVAGKPADQDHPYGYGKAEALAALAIGGLLIAAALLIVAEAVHEIAVPHAAPAPWTLAVLLGVVVVKEALFRRAIRGADEFNSDAARADAWHHRSDAITSVAAFIGVTLAIWGPPVFGIPGLVVADEAAAILASGIIMATAWRLIRPALSELLDAVAHDMAAAVAATARGVEGVRDVEKAFVRKSGAGYHVDMHLHLDPDLTLRDAHALAGKVKATLKRELPALASVLIHIEPGEPATP